MLRLVRLLSCLLLLSVPCVAQSPAASDIPFTLTKGFIVVPAKIKGNVDVQVLVSTGAEHSLTDPALLEKYELSAGYAAEGPVNGVNDPTYSYTTVSKVRIGNSKAKDLNMRLGSLATVSKLIGQEIFATLGADFFEGQTVQVDFKNNVLRFLEKTPPELTDTKNPNYSADKTTVLRMAPKPSNPFQPTFMVPVVRDVQINGQKANLLMDTGIATSVAFSSATAKKVGLDVPTENGPPRQDKTTLRFEATEMADVPIWIYAKGTSGDQSLSKHGAVAGSLFLQQFVATFDYRKGVVILQRF
jgi:hypothetical protein